MVRGKGGVGGAREGRKEKGGGARVDGGGGGVGSRGLRVRGEVSVGVGWGLRGLRGERQGEGGGGGGV